MLKSRTTAQPERVTGGDQKRARRPVRIHGRRTKAYCQPEVC